MSDILRPTMPRREVAGGGPTTLAKLAHQAEDTDDDILLLEVVDEVGRMNQHHPGFERIWLEEYWRLMAARK